MEGIAGPVMTPASLPMACPKSQLPVWPTLLFVHGQLADHDPRPGDLLVPVVSRPDLQRGLPAGQEVVPPAGESGGGDAQFAGDEFQVLVDDPFINSRPMFHRQELRPRPSRFRPGWGGALTRPPSAPMTILRGASGAVSGRKDSAYPEAEPATALPLAVVRSSAG
jgi:hypothetical protein